MALGALLLLVRRVFNEDGWRQGDVGHNHVTLGQRTPIFIVTHRRSCIGFCSRDGDPVEKERQPLLLVLRAAAGQYSQEPQQREQQ